MDNQNIEKGIELLVNKIKSDIAYFNWLNPETPLTIEDVINHLTIKK